MYTLIRHLLFSLQLVSCDILQGDVTAGCDMLQIELIAACDIPQIELIANCCM